MHRTRCLPAISLSVCESVCVWVPKVTERVQSAPCFNGCWSLTETPLTWPARSSSSISNGQDLLQLNALGHQLPSCRVNEPTRQRDAPITKLTLLATSCEMRDVVGYASLPLQHPCGSLWPTAAFAAKRASGSLRERQQSLQYTFSRERTKERESGREWERKL